MSGRRNVWIALPVALGLVLATACGGGGSSGGGGGGGSNPPPPPDNEEMIACATPFAGSLSQAAGTPPVFDDPRAVYFFQITGLTATDPAIEIVVTSTTGNPNLFMATPGTTLGDTTQAAYYFSSSEATGPDSLFIDVAGVENAAGTMDATYGITDFVNAAQDPVFAVVAATTVVNFTVTVNCFPPPTATTALACSDVLMGTVGGSMAATLPDFSNLSETDFYEIGTVGAGVAEVVIDLEVTSGEAHLFLPRPGTIPGSLLARDYVIGATTTGDDRIIIGAAGVTAGTGTDPTYTLADYMAAGTPISFIVTGFDTTTDYVVGAWCIDPTVQEIRNIPCGGSLDNQIIAVGPYLTDLTANHWYRLTGVTGATEGIHVFSSATKYLADAGVVIGSQTPADYVWDDIVGTGPEGWWNLGIGGCSTLEKFQNFPTIPGILAGGQDLSFVVNSAGGGRYARYDLSTICDDVPVQTPILLACGGMASGSLVGLQNNPPTYTDPNETIFYELDMSTLPGVVNSIAITMTSTSGDADVYLAAPGTTPGIPGMIFHSIYGSPDDEILIDATGLTSPPGPQQTATTDWVLSDFLNAPTNLSFAVHSWDLASDFTLTITCN